MGVLDVSLFGDYTAASRFEERFVALDARAVLRLAIQDLYPGRIALVSSFGADSAVLLHMVSTIDTATPVIFVDTGHLFPETLAYRDELVALLGLTNVQAFSPTPEDLAAFDPETFLWSTNPDQCCEVRKVMPLGRAVDGFDAWITGRKRFQSDTRAALPLFEAEGTRTKINPLASWSATRILSYLDAHDLPRHRLVAKNYLSIGCIPCTSPVKPGEDARAGRWRGKSKTECGIHLGVVSGGAGI
ncbi:phosphoadenylyl-sulfate reductase [Lichenihabitans psoromatis]|uniref:phosphoadenylyl-sulfate reductase n=1 Tax=Lichenihabitans psoromatis TaxID=2528642 RepID=UPI0010383770|nr:phosphoadenylyl-sulfate reductase [Lichenihabitans psoromatis]